MNLVKIVVFVPKTHTDVVRQPNMGHDFRFSLEECNMVMTEIEQFIQIKC